MVALILASLTLVALAAPLLWRTSRTVAGIVFAAVPAAAGVWFATLLPEAAEGTILHESWEWVPALDVALTFRLDGLGVAFAVLICLIGALVMLYASGYMHHHPRAGSFFTTLIAFLTAMLGLVLADNIIVLFVFWELTSITSYLLVGFDFDRASARRSALQALLVTGIGGLALLAGLILLGIAAGSYELSAILASPLLGHTLYTPAVILILLGAFSKSAIFPFHFWLPNAMEAPSPVSALLHSSTMVKAGVYLIARLHPALGGAAIWDDALIGLGGLTMLLGAFLATREGELKKVLAYSTVSSLGVMVMLIGMGADAAAAVYLVAHAMFKGCLFMSAGALTMATGVKDIERLRGVVHAMPAASWAAIVGALSMAGLFPLLGFVGKELLLKAGLAHPELSVPVIVATLLAAVMTVSISFLFSVHLFVGEPAKDIAHARDPVWSMLVGPAVLALGGLIAGIAPDLFARDLIVAMIPPGSSTGIKLGSFGYLYPPTAATALSFGVLAAGAIHFLNRARYRRLIAPSRALNSIGPERLYEASLVVLRRSAELQTRTLQNGRLRRYVIITVAVTVLACGAALLRSPLALLAQAGMDAVTMLDVLLAASLGVAAVAVTWQRTAIASAIVLGSIGFIVALIFTIYGAPDVAMTQFAVETLFVIIFVLAIFHLPRYSRLTSWIARTRDWAVSIALGGVMAAMTFAVSSLPAPPSVSVEHAARSVPEAFGRNVVNVILVDFRAMDTLGEIFVIGIAAFGVYTLLLRRGGRASEEER